MVSSMQTITLEHINVVFAVFIIVSILFSYHISRTLEEKSTENSLLIFQSNRFVGLTMSVLTTNIALDNACNDQFINRLARSAII